MSNLNSVINVQVDSYDKDVANKILKQLGLNMSTYINMAIKQLINKNGIPFEVVNPKPNKELLSAIKEGDDIIQEIKEGKRSGYTNIDELFSSLDD